MRNIIFINLFFTPLLLNCNHHNKKAFLFLALPSGSFATTIQNTHNLGVIHSGFLIGNTDTQASFVQISLDGGIFQNAIINGSTWSFGLPNGGSTWKDDSVHTIAIQTLYSSGTPVAGPSISVRKGNNRDVNGDGFIDLILGADNYNSGKGGAFIFLSDGPHGITSRDLSNGDTANTTLIGDPGISGFGGSVDLADVNGDGYADAIIGAKNSTSIGGKAYIFHSAGATGIPNRDISNGDSANTLLSASTSGAFGSSVTLGDINGDGYADAIVGASFARKVFIFHSSGSSGVSSQDLVSGGTANTSLNSSETFFGVSVATGDVNGDNYADLIVGASAANSNQGKVFIYHSSSAGITAIASSPNATFIGKGTSSVFGVDVATGDANGDGKIDLLVGAYGSATIKGQAYIFHSAGSLGIGSQDLSASGTADTILTSDVNLGFGISVSLGDVDGDGYDDAAIGAYKFNSNAGAAYIFHSAGSSGIQNSDLTAGGVATATFVGNSASLFGFTLSISDLNGDGFGDLIVGANDDASNKGSAFVFHSKGNSGVTSQNLSIGGIPSTILTGTSTSHFGTSVSSFLKKILHYYT